MTNQRIFWIDTAKAIGMYFIVLGHFFPSYLTPWLYSFNVPLFFFLSGYLAKKEVSWRIFWKKNLNGLIIPYFILCFMINFQCIIENIGNWKNLVCMTTFCIIGIFKVNDIPGCLNMWFVYSLFIAKVYYQILPDNRKFELALFVCCLVLLSIQHHFALYLSSAIITAVHAIPFFLIGKWCHSYKLIEKMLPAKRWSHLTAMASLFVLSCLLSHYNGSAYLYFGGGGKSLILFYLAAICGISVICLLSILFKNVQNRWANIISKGSILILALHLMVVTPLKHYIVNSRYIQDDSLLANLLYALLAFIIIMLFIPLIQVVQKYFPILIGKRK